MVELALYGRWKLADLRGIDNPKHMLFIVPMGYQNDYLMIPGLKFAGSDLFRMTPKKLTLWTVNNLKTVTDYTGNKQVKP